MQQVANQGCSCSLAHGEIADLTLLSDPDAAELILVRHAEPAPSGAIGRRRDDPFLSCLGLLQAERLAARLRHLRIDAILTAPERRARQTAVILAESTGRHIQTVDDLSDFEAEYLVAHSSRGDCADRLQQARRPPALPDFDPARFRWGAIQPVEAAVTQNSGGRTLIVTHASVINAFLSALLDIPRDLLFIPDFASISVVRWLAGLWQVRSLNDTAHLDGLHDVPSFTQRLLPLTRR